MTDTPPMSAEDRAERLIRYVLNAYPPEHLAAETAQAAQGVMRALSSEGLAVVAREDVPTRYEAKVGLLSLRETHGNGGGEGVKGLRAKLRRLSGADQDG